MGQKEAPRVGLVKALVAGRVVGREVAAALRLSERRCGESRALFEAGGARGWWIQSRACVAAAPGAAACGSGWRGCSRRPTVISMTATPPRGCRRSRGSRSVGRACAGCGRASAAGPKIAAGPGSIERAASAGPAWAR